MKYIILAFCFLAVPAFLIGCHGHNFIKNKKEIEIINNLAPGNDKPSLDGPFWMGANQ